MILYSFSSFLWWTLILCRISYTIWNSFAGPYRMPILRTIHTIATFDNYHNSLRRVFHTTAIWLLFTWVWVTACLLKCPLFFSVLWMILDGLHSSSYFQVVKSLYQSFDDCTDHTNHNFCHSCSSVLFSYLAKNKYLSHCSLSFSFFL